MGFLDTFKGNQYKAELDRLRQEHESLKELMTPEVRDAFNIKQKISRLQEQQATEQKKLSNI